MKYALPGFALALLLATALAAQGPAPTAFSLSYGTASGADLHGGCRATFEAVPELQLVLGSEDRQLNVPIVRLRFSEVSTQAGAFVVSDVQVHLPLPNADALEHLIPHASRYTAEVSWHTFTAHGRDIEHLCAQIVTAVRNDLLDPELHLRLAPAER